MSGVSLEWTGDTPYDFSTHFQFFSLHLKTIHLLITLLSIIAKLEKAFKLISNVSPTIELLINKLLLRDVFKDEDS